MKELEKYVGTKTVLAVKMTLSQFKTNKGIIPNTSYSDDTDGYLVEYTDGGKPNHPDHKGYIAWAPKEVFEKSYKKVFEESFQARMYEEEVQLHLKIEKLTAFIVSKSFDTLPEIERDALKEQLIHMKAYYSVLMGRVSRTCGNA